MPDTALADGDVYDAAFHEANVRKQVVAQLATASLPAAATEGRLFADTTVNALKIDTGAALMLFGCWASQTFTPTITAATTSPTGWTTAGRYVQMGALVYAEASFTYGAGTAAVGNLRFGLPVTARAAGWVGGTVRAADSGGLWYMRHPYLPATTFIECATEGGTALTGATPFTPAAGDVYYYSVVYLAA